MASKVLFALLIFVEAQRLLMLEAIEKGVNVAACGLLWVLGQSVSLEAGQVILEEDGGMTAFSGSALGVGLWGALLASVIAAVLFGPGWRTKECLGVLCSLCFAFAAAVADNVLCATLVSTTGLHQLLLHPVRGGLAALAVMWWWGGGIDQGPTGLNARLSRGGVGVGLALCFGLIGVRADLSGMRAPAVIGIDEYHSDWEPHDELFDSSRYGVASTYNYALLGRYLRRAFGEVRSIDDELNQDVLSCVDVLIVKTPSVPFSADEITALRGFVRDGGGLLLFGDHTDVFGSSTVLNAISAHYGVYFRADTLEDCRAGVRQVWVERLLLEHPVAAGLGALQFASSCSLALNEGALPVLIAQGLRADDADYSKDNFIGNNDYEAGESLGIFVQAASSSTGRGRVLCFADSTIFSNFSFFEEGVQKFLFRSVTWSAGGRAGGRWLQGVGWLVICLAALITLMIRLDSVLVLGCALCLAGALSKERAVAAFEGRGWRSGTNLGVFGIGEDISWRFERDPLRSKEVRLNSLLMCMARAGSMPFIESWERIEEWEGDLLVVDFGGEGVRAEPLLQYLRDGGRALILCGVDPGRSMLIETLGFGIGPSLAGATVVNLSESGRSSTFRNAWELRGGDALVADEQGRVVGVRRAVGKGEVWAVALGEDLADEGLGAHSNVPRFDQLQRRLFLTELMSSFCAIRAGQD